MMNVTGVRGLLTKALLTAMVVAGSAGCTIRRLPSATPTTPAAVTQSPQPAVEAADFCRFVVSADRAARGAKSSAQGLRALRALEPQVDQHLGRLPASVKADATVVLEAARRAIETRNLRVLATDRVARAGARLAKRCGVRSK